ncbi:unnamed protein product [Symbiodinium sp. CCMP2456]|nr:unnamed protein product [Symbiodinium sp. CCMP2456]
MCRFVQEVVETFYIFLFVVSAVRYDFEDVQPPTTSSFCRSTCGKPTTEEPCAARQSLYELRGEAAVQLSWQLTSTTRYFIGNPRCEALEDISTSVVPWVDPKDPLNESRILIFMDAVHELKLRRSQTAAVLCGGDEKEALCICTLAGNEPLAGFDVLGALASSMPSVASQRLYELQASLERRCPWPQVINRYGAALLLMALLILVLVAEAAWAARRAEVPEDVGSVWPDDLVFFKTPLKNFTAGFTWLFGFVTSIIALQTVALVLLKKSDDSEYAESKVWLIIIYPCILTIIGAYRLMILLCKKQLSHACGERAMFITEPVASNGLDAFLLGGLCAYAVGLLLQTGMGNIILVFSALLGPAWSMMKALMQAHQLEAELDRVQTDWMKASTARADLPKAVSRTWKSVLAAGRAGSDLTSDPVDDPHGSGDMQLILNFGWYRRTVLQLTGSRSGFLILPSFALMLAFFLSISGLQSLNYACSCGELTDLSLASSLHTLKFKPWQAEYVVDIDTSFKQASMLAYADTAATRWISVLQPNGSPSKAPIGEEKGASITEVVLTNMPIPRIATVQVKGLRTSLAEKQYMVRFAPMQTLPVALVLSSGNFSTTLPWSALSGTVVSVPRVTQDVEVKVILTEFHLSLPVRHDLHNQHPSSVQEWTAFERKDNNSNRSWCHHRCDESLDCLRAFPGEGGCFYAQNDHKSRQVHHSNTPVAVTEGRKISGTLTGCRSQTSSDTCRTVPAKADELSFGKVSPDWHGSFARLSLKMILDVGEMNFTSDYATIDLRQGLPGVTEAICLLVVRMSNGTHSTLKVRSFAESGEVMVRVSNYDPLEVASMDLIILPLLPDIGFNVSWSPSGGQVNMTHDDRIHLRSSTKCTESSRLRARYAACGAKHGIDDEPLKVKLLPWTGNPEDPVAFTVVPRKAQGGQWTSPSMHSMKMSFEGADSPAFWAARKHGCELLKREEPEIRRSLLSSGDALCHFIEQDCAKSTKLCELIDKESLGGGNDWSYAIDEHIRQKPLLGHDSTVKLLATLKKHNVCKITYKFFYKDTYLQLEEHGATVSLSIFLREVAALGQTGSDFLEAVRSSMDEKSRKALDEDLPQAVWQVPRFSANLTISVANFSADMQQKLLENMISSKMHLQEKEVHQLQPAFAEVKRLNLGLTTPEQLGEAAEALRLAPPELEKLSLTCKGCPQSDREGLVEHWLTILPHMRLAKELIVEYFVLSNPSLGEPLRTSLAACNAKDVRLLRLQLGPNAKQLAEGLGLMASLEELFLRDVSLGDFAKWMPNMKNLTYFVYKHGTPESAAAALRGLEANPPQNVKTFDFSWTAVGPEEGRRLPKILQRLRQVQAVSLDENRLDEAVGEELVEAVGEMKELREMRLEGNDIREETKKKIQEACRRNQED